MTKKLFTLASIRRIVLPVGVPGAAPYTCDAQAGAYCLVEWAEPGRVIRIRNMNSDAHAEPIAAALQAAGLGVALVVNAKSSLNRITLLVSEIPA